VTKDRLYLDQADGLSRRSVQTVMYHMYNYLLGMLAPLTPMLVEEAWEHTPEALKRDAIHPLRRLYPTAPELWRNESLEAVLPLFLRAKEAVNAAQERLRLDKQIGSSLESVITLSFPASTSELYTVFQAYEPELEALFVTSKLTLVLESEGQEQPTTTDGPIDCVASAPFGLDSRVEAAVHAHSVKYMQPPKSKCARCWRHAAPADVEEDQALCGRCMRVVEQWHA
jgi:isoleucyl-tRNA synthetase